MRIAIIVPGLGKRYDKEIEFLWNTDLNIILDADGLDWLSRKKPKKRSAPWVGTPHRGEVKKLLENNISDKWSNLIKLKKNIWWGLDPQRTWDFGIRRKKVMD